MSGGWFDEDAIASERLDADIEMAELQAAGRDYARSHRRMVKLLAAGDKVGAAKACMHGSGYPLDSLAARNSSDPRAGDKGLRCTGCGSILTEWRGAVLEPCEWIRPQV
jgi:hypothetical protein